MGVKYCPGLELLGLDSRACLVFHKPGVVKLEPQVFGADSAGGGSVDDTKKCPYCAETIKKKQYCADFVAKIYKSTSSSKGGINENYYGINFITFISHGM